MNKQSRILHKSTCCSKNQMNYPSIRRCATKQRMSETPPSNTQDSATKTQKSPRRRDSDFWHRCFSPLVEKMQNRALQVSIRAKVNIMRARKAECSWDEFTWGSASEDFRIRILLTRCQWRRFIDHTRLKATRTCQIRL